MSMRTGVTSNVGAKSKIQTKCIEGGRSPSHTFKVVDSCQAFCKVPL